MCAQCSLYWRCTALSEWHKPAVQLPESAGVCASIHRGIGWTVKSFLEFFKVANCTIDPKLRGAVSTNLDLFSGSFLSVGIAPYMSIAQEEELVVGECDTW